MKNTKKEIVAILDNIRSVYNVGSIFRTADAAGIVRLVLVGTTPTPIDRFGRARKDLAKVSLGAEKTVAWEYFKATEEAFISLQEQGFRIVAVEQDKISIDYRKYLPGTKLALVFGNEVDGISKDILDKCDEIVEIPMNGEKESLNVSVAFGIIAFGFLN